MLTEKKSTSKSKSKHLTHTKAKRIAIRKTASNSDLKKILKMTKIIFSEKTPVPDVNNDQHEIDENQRTSRKSNETDVANANIDFFYSNKKFFDSYEDNDILEYIKSKYPEFTSVYPNKYKECIIAMIQNKKFVEQLLCTYDMNIQQFFMFIFKNDISIFKGPFVAKVSKIINQMNYK